MTPALYMDQVEEKELVYHGFDHITWYVGNAKQAASYYVTRMGFKEIAYRGIETGDRHTASHVLSNGKAKFVFVSLLNAMEFLPGKIKDEYGLSCKFNEIHKHISKHGDGVKDIAFQVDDAVAVWEKAVAKGARSIEEPHILKDEDGELVVAVISTYGDTTHTLIDRSRYRGDFMPGYVRVTEEDPINQYLPKVDVTEIDHCVGNQPWDGLDSAVE
jgi:4-hydroxyphenylpyruvate dioxygenase